MLHIYENYKWHYDQALHWLHHTYKLAKKKKHIFLALGSHSPSVITLGYNANHNHILNPLVINNNNIIIRKTKRGGGITIHMQGQLIIYTIISIPHFNININYFIKILETCMITTCKYWKINAYKQKSKIGIYIKYKKIGFIGLKNQYGIITHGISLNINNNIDIYAYFIPCNNNSTIITSLKEILNHNISISIIGKQFIKLFIYYIFNKHI